MKFPIQWEEYFLDWRDLLAELRRVKKEKGRKRATAWMKELFMKIPIGSIRNEVRTELCRLIDQSADDQDDDPKQDSGEWLRIDWRPEPE